MFLVVTQIVEHRPGRTAVLLGRHGILGGMGEFLFVPYPAWGHVNPMLPVIERLVAGGDIVRRAMSEAFVQVGHDGDIAVLGEAARELTVELIPARGMVNHDDARVRPRAVGSGDVGVDLIAAPSRHQRNAGHDAPFGVRPERVPSRHELEQLLSGP